MADNASAKESSTQPPREFLKVCRSHTYGYPLEFAIIDINAVEWVKRDGVWYSTNDWTPATRKSAIAIEEYMARKEKRMEEEEDIVREQLNALEEVASQIPPPKKLQEKWAAIKKQRPRRRWLDPLSEEEMIKQRRLILGVIIITFFLGVMLLWSSACYFYLPKPNAQVMELSLQKKPTVPK